MSTHYGSWVATDDYRSVMDVSTSSTNTATTITITMKVQTQYGTTSGYDNIKAQGKVGSNSYTSGAFAISTNTTKTIATKSWSVSRTHSSQSVSCSNKVYGISGTYSGTSSTASTTVTVSAKPSYAITYYGNGSTSGSTAAQTKWYGESIALRSNGFAKTGHTFKGWATSASGSVAYAAGATYTGNAALNLYAVWQANTYAVTYNANGGSGAPATGYKTYGTTYTISSTRPTRAGYTFKGWATSSSSTTPTYQPGGSYTTNAALSLYAVWVLSYASPTITGLNAIRCDSFGNEDDEGTYALLTFSWTIDSTDANSPSLVYRTRPRGGSYGSDIPITASGTSGSVSEVISTFLTTTAYDIQVELTDSHDLTATTATYLSPAAFTLDFLAGGKGVAVGKACPSDGFHVAWDADFDGDIRAPIGGVSTKWLSINSNTATVSSYGDASFRNLNVNGSITYGNAAPMKDASDTTAVSKASGSWTSRASITLDAGTWIIIGACQFASNATGRRGINISTTSGSTSTSAAAAAVVPAANGMQTVVSRSWVQTLTGSTTYHLNVYQNSGAALDTYAYLRAVRVA